jgi:hypothetical protein
VSAADVAGAVVGTALTGLIWWTAMLPGTNAGGVAFCATVGAFTLWWAAYSIARCFGVKA